MLFEDPSNLIGSMGVCGASMRTRRSTHSRWRPPRVALSCVQVTCHGLLSFAYCCEDPASRESSAPHRAQLSREVVTVLLTFVRHIVPTSSPEQDLATTIWVSYHDGQLHASPNREFRGTRALAPGRVGTLALRRAWGTGLHGRTHGRLALDRGALLIIGAGFGGRPCEPKFREVRE